MLGSTEQDGQGLVQQDGAGLPSAPGAGWFAGAPWQAGLGRAKHSVSVTMLSAVESQAAETHLQLFSIVRKAGAFISKAVSRFPTNCLEFPHVLLMLKWECWAPLAILMDDERQT